MLRRLVEYFIPSKVLHSDADLRSERIFVWVLLVAALADFMGIGLAVDLRLMEVAWLLGINGIINLVLLAAYKNGLPKPVAAHGFIVQHGVSFAVQAWHQGGLVSPATAAYFLLPAVAILILGKRSALFWLIITAIVTTIFFIYETAYGSPDIFYDPSKRPYLFYSSVLGTNISIFIILLIYENSKNKALELAARRLQELTAAQAQLVQSEKMASLGELTAGIAHEIQNPLNFVNNFSDVNQELLTELKEEIEKGNLDHVNTLASTAIENQEKITHHGKRADAIVKSMLQHSRKGTGQRELTDINALCDEYLRLAYHGLRAKDKSFNAKFEAVPDPTLPKVNVMAQDIGRVVLNLINNAFYAVSEKKKLSDSSYEPAVTITTKKLENTIEIRVKDNGKGVPENVKEKIFQPFFTTKPAGQGTGLGLSLSYDIITKGHGGEIKVISKENEGSAFIIILPIV